jgi:hypothetical protein
MKNKNFILKLREMSSKRLGYHSIQKLANVIDRITRKAFQYNVTLRRGSATLVAVQNNEYYIN